MLANGPGVRGHSVRLLISHATSAPNGTCCNSQFIQNNYLTIKQHNPDLPVLIREATGTPARVFARFGACHVPLHLPEC